MAPSNPIELLEQMSDQYARLDEDFDRLMEEGDSNKEECRLRHAQICQESTDIWHQIMTYVYKVRHTHQAEADAFMKHKHGMTWGADPEYEGYSS
jgi:hypothetical protein